MERQSTTRIAIIVIVILIGAGIWWLFLSPYSGGGQERAVKNAVTSFGKELQMVSVLAATSTAAEDITTYYSPYVAAELLSQWKASPSHAPGRLTSSPKPDHIDISSITKNSDGSYSVEANIVEVTDTDQSTVAATHPITLTLSNATGRWLIVSYAAN